MPMLPDIGDLDAAALERLIAEEEARLWTLEREMRQAVADHKASLAPQMEADRDVVAIYSLHAFLQRVWPVLEGEGTPFIDAPYIRLICEDIQAAIEEIDRRCQQVARLVAQADGDSTLLADLIAKHMGHLQQIKLVLAVPPRHGKTIIAKIVALAWVLLRWPSWKSIAVGAAGLTEDHGPKLRRLITSATYQRLVATASAMRGRAEPWTVEETPEEVWRKWPIADSMRAGGSSKPWTLAADQNTKTFFDTSEGGRFLAQSINAGITGKGCRIMVIDDPVDAKKALKATPDVAAKWMADIETNWTTALRDRFDEPALSLVIVIMQRLHPDDLAGYFIKHEAGTQVVCFPTEYDPDHPYLHPKDPRTKRGELLNPARRGQRWVDDEKASDLHAFNCKHQGLPTLKQGALVQRSWFAQRWASRPLVMADRLLSEGARFTVDVDAAMKGGTDNDWYVCLLIATTRDGRRFPLDCASGHWTWPEFRDKLWAFYAKWQRHLRASSGEFCIEDAAHGITALQNFAGRIYGLVGFKPSAPEEDVPKARRMFAKVPSKEERWPLFIDEMERGQWQWPEAHHCPWVEDFLTMLCALPQQGRDHADVCAQRAIRDAVRANRGVMATATWGSRAGRQRGRPRND